MSKRHGEDSDADVPFSKKANLTEDVDELEKKLLVAEREVEELPAVISKNKARIDYLQELIFNLNQELNEKKSANLELNKQLKVFKNSILKMKSQKNRLLNPVCLSSDLYDDVFKAVNEQKVIMKLKDVLKFFLIGKETHLPIVQLMRQCVQIEFKDDKFYWENDDAALDLTYCKFSENLIKPIIPYVTKVRLDCENPTNFNRLFFEILSKNQEQKSLTIWNLKHANDVVVEALKKLNEKNIPIKLTRPSKEVLLDLPGVHFDILKIKLLDCSFKEWFHVLVCMPCTFTKLQLPHFEWGNRQIWGEAVVVNAKELLITWDFDRDYDFFERLNKHFPNAQKLTVTFLKILGSYNEKYFDELKYCKYLWNRRKNWITDAPQKEIVANFGYVTDSKRKYERAIRLFGGERIDDKTLRWTSPTDNSKIINFHRRLSYVELDYVDDFNGWDIHSESGTTDEEVDSGSDDYY
uniref:DUF38 domain-containing protein n=1 Tax=Panagrolaimus sp. JU765 TaxID=591449 RepID=A0AC34QF26_9BILA